MAEVITRSWEMGYYFDFSYEFGSRKLEIGRKAIEN